jgi:DNA-binding transcriptional regulator YdaS (Cro superfamily)
MDILMFEEVISYFGSVEKTAMACGVRGESVSYWGRMGIPPRRAIDIERLTEGRFKAQDIVGSKRLRKIKPGRKTDEQKKAPERMGAKALQE